MSIRSYRNSSNNSTERKEQDMGDFLQDHIVCLTGGIFAFLLAIAAVVNAVNVIDEGEKGVVLTFGEISRTWEPGLHVKVPFVQTVETYNMRVQKTTFGINNYDSAEDNTPNENRLQAYSNDQQIIESYCVSMTWAYAPDRVEDVYKYFGADSAATVFSSVVRPTVIQTTKAILGQFTAQTIVQQRARLDAAIETSLKEQLHNLPINIMSVQFEDVSFSQKYEEVIEQTAQKKMEIEKAQNELQRIQIEAQQQVAQAEARNKAIRLQADADAYKITALAKAEAEAIRMKGEALRANRELIDLTIAEKWDGTVPQTVIQGNGGNSVVPLLNLSRDSSKK